MHLLALALVLAQAAAPAPAPATPQAPEPTPKPAPTGPVVAFDVAQGRTALGTITIALDAEKAPISVGTSSSTSAPGTTTGPSSTA